MRTAPIAVGSSGLCTDVNTGPRTALEVLVRTVNQVDRCGCSLDVEVVPASLPGGYFRSDDGPSGPAARSKVDALQD
jgi:hypothetical protein